MANYLPSEATRDKQIATFARRQRVVLAAIDFARACQTGRLVWRGEAQEALLKAVKAYKPQLFDSCAPQHTGDSHG